MDLGGLGQVELQPADRAGDEITLEGSVSAACKATALANGAVTRRASEVASSTEDP